MQASGTDVFVSYKAEDRARLKPLVDALEAEGFSVWWDAQIGGGTNWHEDIEQHLDTAKCVVVAWTKRSTGHDGHFVRDEARRAQRRDAYMPVCLDAVEPPLGFGEVQTISLKGWHGDRSDPRFQAVVHAVRSHVSGEHVSHSLGAGHLHFREPSISRRTAILGGGGVAAVAIAGVSAWELLKPAPANAKRIAVMDFDNLSGDPNQAYFAQGIAEELRSCLTRVGMQVIGRSSCDAVKGLDIKAAASKLDVANVLTGSFRRSPATIRIEAQLVSGSDGVEHWAQSYDRAPGDAIKIQTDIAESVASSLRLALGAAAKSALTLGGTADSAAQDLVLQSRLLSRETTAQSLLKGIALAQAAIGRDRNYADAYVQLAVSLWALATNFTTNIAEVASQVGHAADATNRALAIAPRLGSAHAALGLVNASRLQFPEALQQMRQALALSPDDSSVLPWAIGYLAYLGAANEMSGLADRFIALDPLNPLAYRRKAEVLYVLGRYPDALAAAKKALQLAPNGSNAHIWAANSLLLMGRPQDALAEFRAMPAGDPFRLTGEAIAAARSGDTSTAESKVEQLKREGGATASYQYAQIRSQLGQKDLAFAELNNAVAAKDGGLIYLKMDRFLDPLRSDARYTALVQRLRFP